MTFSRLFDVAVGLPKTVPSAFVAGAVLSIVLPLPPVIATPKPAITAAIAATPAKPAQPLLNIADAPSAMFTMVFFADIAIEIIAKPISTL